MRILFKSNSAKETRFIIVVWYLSGRSLNDFILLSGRKILLKVIFRLSEKKKQELLKINVNLSDFIVTRTMYIAISSNNINVKRWFPQTVSNRLSGKKINNHNVSSFGIVDRF